VEEEKWREEPSLPNGKKGKAPLRGIVEFVWRRFLFRAKILFLTGAKGRVVLDGKSLEP